MKYPISDIYKNDHQISPLPIVGESMDLSAYFGSGVEIDALCHAAEKQRYIVKGVEKIIFFDYNFTPRESIDIVLDDLHGDIVMSQTIEYYKGYLLHLNARKPEGIEVFKSAYLNVNRSGTSKSMVESYRYFNRSEAEGICNIGNGKYLFTYYECNKELKQIDIEIRLLNFNTPSHTHTLSDIFDLKMLKRASGTLYVNPQLDGKSYLAPDGSMKKPFPNIEEAVAYGKVFLSEATILLMRGNYGTVELSNVAMNLTLKGLSKEGCLVDRIKISKCRELRFEDLTFCDSEHPFEATSSTVEINRCSFPNGRESGSGPSGNYGISITKNSTVMLQACEISQFNSAVNLASSTLYLEGCNALQGTGNRCLIRGENSEVWGAKGPDGAGRTVGSTSLTACRLDGELVTIPFAPGSMNIGRVGAIRPVHPETGCYYFEAMAGKTLWWNGSAWVDVTGAEYLPQPA